MLPKAKDPATEEVTPKEFKVSFKLFGRVFTFTVT